MRGYKPSVPIRVNVKSCISDYTVSQYADVIDIIKRTSFDSESEKADKDNVCLFLSKATDKDLSFWHSNTSWDEVLSLFINITDKITSIKLQPKSYFIAPKERVNVVDMVLYNVKIEKVKYSLRYPGGLCFEEIIQLEPIVKSLADEKGVKIDDIGNLSLFLAYVMDAGDERYFLDDNGVLSYDFSQVEKRMHIFNDIHMDEAIGILSEYLTRLEALVSPYQKFMSDIQSGMPKASNAYKAYYDRWGAKCIQEELSKRVSSFSPSEQRRMPYKKVLSIMSQLREKDACDYKEEKRQQNKNNR